jgi:cell division protein FtsI/penicillin-binding protein 2
LAALLVLWGLAISGRLFFLQVVESAGYVEDARRQQQRAVRIDPPRGPILDRSGKMLAGTIKVDSVFADPQAIENLGSTAAALATVTGIPPMALAERLANRNSQYVSIQRRIPPTAKREIQALRLPGIGFEEDSQRLYPGRQLGAHLIGYVSADGIGLGGLEYKYDKYLKGEAGQAVVLVDARSNGFQRIEREPVAGSSITTTIDEHIQYIVDKEVLAAAPRVRKTGGIAVVAMNPQNGEILAMSSYPTFNPNDIRQSRPEDRINRVVNQIYEPGSTFKIATVAAALEEKLTTKEERIDCQMGSILLFNHRIRDHKPFGVLTVSEIMQFSSDVGVIKLGLRLGDDRLSGYLDRLGFGHATGIDLPGEVRGLLRPTSKWSKISIGAISMGQEVGVTPLQILGMVSAVANGGMLYRPYVVSKIEHPRDGVVFQAEPRGRRAISGPTAKELQEMLEVVVTDGTAKASKPEGYRAAGKTGTAQKIDETGRYSATKFVASFAGYAPASNPSVAVIVVIDEPLGAYHGGEVAAPIFKRIVEQILRYRSVPPDVPEYSPRYAIKPGPPTVPRAAPPQKDWAVVSAAAGAFSGNSADPAEESTGDIVMPDYRGKWVRDAVIDAAKLGILVRPTGHGRAVAQEPPPGTRVYAGATVDVTFDFAP